MSVRFHLFVSNLNQGNKDFKCKKVCSRFSCMAPGMERFSLDLPRAVKKVLWKWYVGVCRICSHRLKVKKLF